MYQVTEDKMDRLLASLQRIGARLDEHPMKTMILADPEAKEFIMALSSLQDEINKQKADPDAPHSSILINSECGLMVKCVDNASRPCLKPARHLGGHNPWP